MDPRENLFALKLLAYLHDPAEKALILLRSQGGHEEGSSVAELRRLFFPDEEWVQRAMKWVRQADHWASAADRPIFPKAEDAEERRSTEVRFWDSRSGGGVLVHPLSGDTFEMEGDLSLDRASRISSAVLEHLKSLLAPWKDRRLDTDPEQAQRAFLTLWRWGAQEGPPKLGLGSLWHLLPADTRIPDHSIWNHLSLTAAFAGAMAGDEKGRPALLSFSIGPVQAFLAQSKATADLWGASHLLSFGLFRAMEPILEEAGPEAVLFPNLWGNPFVDLWLHEKHVQLPGKEPWGRDHSDRNPLCRASLPNRFLALVPQDRGQALAKEAEKAVRRFFLDAASRAAGRALRAETLPDFTAGQVDRQMESIPEVFWSVVPWGDLLQWRGMEGPGEGGTAVEDHGRLAALLARFYPASAAPPGFLQSPAVALVEKYRRGQGTLRFFDPNPGFYYPALFDVAVRGLEAAKTSRTFAGTLEEGYRCTLCGEREWLSPKEEYRFRRVSGLDEKEDPWKKAPPPVREGEHLCAPCCLKRYWFKEFKDHILKSAGVELDFFPLSTHTVAVAPDLAKVLAAGDSLSEKQREALQELEKNSEADLLPALPYRTLRELETDQQRKLCRKIVAMLDHEEDGEERDSTRKLVKDLLGHPPEAYYGIFLLDGDRMGALLNGQELPPLQRCFHRNIASFIQRKMEEDPLLDQYLRKPRPLSPSFHHSLSASLADFASHLAPFVVEECFSGKVIYAGGDDVLAMVAARDLLPCLWAIRALFSGDGKLWEAAASGDMKRHRVDRGFVHMGGHRPRLFRVLSPGRTASAGAVLAHHKAPLQVVLRRVREAERRAKSAGGNAYSLSLLKRSGGESAWTSSFGATNPAALGAVRDLLASPKVSRRAAYHVLAWLPSLPLDVQNSVEMVKKALAYQFERQGAEREQAREVTGQWVDHCQSLARCLKGRFDLRESLVQSLSIAEFLARECRQPSRSEEPAQAARREEKP